MIFFVGIAEWAQGEHRRRLELWSTLTETGTAEGLAPSTIRDTKLYAGQAGIFFDGQGDWNTGGPGRVALTLKLTDKAYADDAGEDDLQYHYPSTDRHASFDRNEIDSVKRAQSLGFPLFIVSPNRLQKSRTDVCLGYVDDYRDDEAMFFVTFVESVLPLATPDELPPPTTTPTSSAASPNRPCASSDSAPSSADSRPTSSTATARCAPSATSPSPA